MKKPCAPGSHPYDVELVLQSDAPPQQMLPTVAAVLAAGWQSGMFLYVDKVIPQIGEEGRATVAPLLDLKIKTPAGELVPVSAFTRIETSAAPRTLNRFQQRNAVRVIGGVKPGVSASHRHGPGGRHDRGHPVHPVRGPGLLLDHRGRGAARAGPRVAEGPWIPAGAGRNVGACMLIGPV